MKQFYEKSELAFVLVLIGVYCVLQSLANPLGRAVGVPHLFHAVFNLALTAVLFCFIRKNGLSERYGLSKPTVPARRFLWYLPLVLIVSINLWNGAAIHFSPLDSIFYLAHMLCVGFVEEVLFRGFLFRAIAKDGVNAAIVISSVTFGLGHLLNLVNGSGMELAANLWQVCGAMAAGFLFVTLFYRGGSLLPCVAAHSAINMVSAFVNETGLTPEKRITFSLIRIGIIVGYTLLLLKLLPKKGAAAGGQAEHSPR